MQWNGTRPETLGDRERGQRDGYFRGGGLVSCTAMLFRLCAFGVSVRRSNAVGRATNYLQAPAVHSVRDHMTCCTTSQPIQNFEITLILHRHLSGDAHNAPQAIPPTIL